MTYKTRRMRTVKGDSRVFKRLIKASLMAFAVLPLVFPGSAGDCQTRRLPKAQFQRYGGSMLPATQSVGGFGHSSNYDAPNTNINSTPGVHLTTGEDRGRQDATTPYNPGEPSLNMKLVRWQREKMPLRIWISPGLKLPEVPFTQLQATRVEQVFNMLKEEYPFSDLPVANGWTEQTNYQVAAGIEQWRQFQNEGLVSFGFTTDPKQAQIFVFFVSAFRGASGPGGINVGGNTCAQLFTPDQLRDPRYKQKPVIIELSTAVNHIPEKMQGASAHEFGHALGIKAHSPYRNDIMYADRVVNTLSEGDKNTIRKLYQVQPQYFM